MRQTPRGLADCQNILDLRELARRRLPHPLFHYLDGAAETEVTAQRNTCAFDEYPLVPRCLVDVTSVKTATRILGQQVEWPVLCSPTGASRFFHPEGELAVARAAAKSGTLYALSMAATSSLEEVASVSDAPKLFQLYVFKDRAVTHELIERCKCAGYKALCLTVDAAVRGKRERDLRTGFGTPSNLSLSGLARFALRPGWTWGQMRRGPLAMPNIAHRATGRGIVAHSKYFSMQLDASVTWQDAQDLIQRWGGPFAIKGIMSATDARRAADIGATAVIVSNHGGRQLDGAAATIDVLPQIARAVGDRVEVILDGGIRRGVHVLKALARGAKACSIGRPYLYGLSAGGAPGVEKALNILRSELVLAMQLTGCVDLAQIDESLIQATAGSQTPDA